MIKIKYFKKTAIILFAMTFLCTGCGKPQVQKLSGEEVYEKILTQIGGRTTCEKIQMPDDTDKPDITSDKCEINTLHKDNGYIIFTYKGESDKVVLQIKQPDNTTYSYPINNNEPQVLALVSGNGTYGIEMLEHTKDNTYVRDITTAIPVIIKNEFEPFLYPNQYVNYTPDANCVALGKILSNHADTDLTYVKNVYDYITTAISYDTELAKNIGTNYIPDPDKTLESKTGICFDYASLMTAMLRSQNIPTKLEVGYAGTAYHAWISVYLEDIGWIDNIIKFDGKNWSFMDPTVAANKDSDENMQKLIGDGTTYTVQYHY